MFNSKHRYHINVTFANDHPMAFRPGTIGRETHFSAQTLKDALSLVKGLAFMGAQKRLHSDEQPSFDRDKRLRCSWVSPCGLCAIEVIDTAHSVFSGDGWTAALSPTKSSYR